MVYIFRSTIVVLMFLVIVAPDDSKDSGPDERLPSMADLVEYLDLAATVAPRLDSGQLGHQPDDLYKVADELQHLSDKLVLNPAYFLGNPINAYILVRKLTAVAEILQDGQYTDSWFKRILEFGDNKSLRGTLSVIVRLQLVYNLTSTQIIFGEFPGVGSSPQLGADDCFLIGFKYHLQKDNYNFLKWMISAMKVFEREQTVMPTHDKVELMTYLAMALYRQDNIPAAYGTLKQILDINPSNKFAKENIDYYKALLHPDESREYSLDNVKNEPGQVSGYHGSDEYIEYTKLCRHEVSTTDNNLHCYYRHTQGRFYLAPLKAEAMNLDPPIVVYHGILSDDDAELIRKTATPLLFHSRVHGTNTNLEYKQQYTTARTSQQAWLSAYEYPVAEMAKDVSVEALGLAMDTAENLQVATYTAGGHFEPHVDHQKKGAVLSELTVRLGDRIATAIYYLEDVAAGGNTVFPRIGVVLPPEKGAMAVWYNLLPDGRGDGRTTHGACPVLAGVKWIGTVWFHHQGNHVNRPCGLTPDE